MGQSWALGAGLPCPHTLGCGNAEMGVLEGHSAGFLRVGWEDRTPHLLLISYGDTERNYTSGGRCTLRHGRGKRGDLFSLGPTLPWMLPALTGDKDVKKTLPHLGPAYKHTPFL